MQQKTDVSPLPAGNGDDKASVDMKHNIINNGPDGVSSAEKTGYPSSTTTVVICNSAQYGRLSVALLEIIGSKGAVKVNGKTYGNKSRRILSGGDEVVFKYGDVQQRQVGCGGRRSEVVHKGN
ncbi:hypothetical protein TSUD_38090 [Trifolium subterraneum]|uniref:Uncharacterized protein n=1 Tax=Trifolium subterraneum TaxID=3900 RepID=A0A2Z6N6U8_TRISU|nr:hypothetical protein TSUD_38090 [Trifolium subterraneum]